MSALKKIFASQPGSGIGLLDRTVGVNMKHGRFRRIFFGLAVGLVALMPDALNAADSPDEVRFGWFGGPRPWVIGKAEGLFEKRLGTKIKWVQFPSGAAALSAITAKELDISRFGSTGTVAAIVRGVPVEMIVLSGVIATSERLIAKPEIASVSDLVGKTVAYPPGSTAHYALMAALRANGVDASKVKLLSMKPNEMVAAWQRDDIAAGYVWGPFSHRMEEAGGRALLATRDLQEHGYYIWNNYIVRKAFARKHPRIVVQFLKAFQETMDIYNRDGDDAVRIVSTHLSQKFDSAKDTMAGLEFIDLKEQLTGDWLGGTSSPIAKAMHDSATFLEMLGEVRKREIPEDFQPYINTTYMEKAVND